MIFSKLLKKVIFALIVERGKLVFKGVIQTPDNELWRESCYVCGGYKWYPISEAPPVLDTYYLTFWGYDDVYHKPVIQKSHFIIHNGENCWDGKKYQPLFWMPLPDPPEVE